MGKSIVIQLIDRRNSSITKELFNGKMLKGVPNSATAQALLNFASNYR